jgi:hypothetical protein
MRLLIAALALVSIICSLKEPVHGDIATPIETEQPDSTEVAELFYHMEEMKLPWIFDPQKIDLAFFLGTNSAIKKIFPKNYYYLAGAGTVKTCNGNRVILVFDKSVEGSVSYYSFYLLYFKGYAVKKITKFKGKMDTFFCKECSFYISSAGTVVFSGLEKGKMVTSTEDVCR